MSAGFFAFLLCWSQKCKLSAMQSSLFWNFFSWNSDLVQCATSEGVLGVFMSDTSWGQASLLINKTRLGIRRSADQVQFAYVGSVSVFLSSVRVENLTGHNPTEDISFVKAIVELGKISTYPSHRKIQEEIDNSAFDNLLRKQSSIRKSLIAISFCTVVWCLVLLSPHSSSGITPIVQ